MIAASMGLQFRTATSAEPADRLPEPARLFALRERRDELLLVVRALTDQIQEVRLEQQRQQAFVSSRNP
jgi:hypothetical protein